MASKKPGQPTKYKPEYCRKIIEFFDRELTEKKKTQAVTPSGKVVEYEDEVATNLPLFEDFAHSIGVHRETLLNWCNAHREFFDAYKRAKELQHRHLVTNGLHNRYQSTFAVFTAKNILGWRSEPKDSQDEKKVSVSITYDKDE